VIVYFAILIFVGLLISLWAYLRSLEAEDARKLAASVKWSIDYISAWERPTIIQVKPTVYDAVERGDFD
jgi:hypothetical protein